jgi:hypothetical protein
MKFIHSASNRGTEASAYFYLFSVSLVFFYFSSVSASASDTRKDDALISSYLAKYRYATPQCVSTREVERIIDWRAQLKDLHFFTCPLDVFMTRVIGQVFGSLSRQVQIKSAGGAVWAKPCHHLPTQTGRERVMEETHQTSQCVTRRKQTGKGVG